MSERVSIYVAGPYSKDPQGCTEEAIRVGNELRNLGFYPFIPHLFHYWEQETERHYEDWFDMDLFWLEKCDAMYRIDGDSPGADREEAFCKKHRIPVYKSMDKLVYDLHPREMSGRIFCIVGPSGVGKTTLQEELKPHVSNVAVSYTTRDMRKGEFDGIDYNFVTEEEFQTLSEDGDLIEEVGYKGNRYGLIDEDFMLEGSSGGSVLTVVNRDGVEALRSHYGDDAVFSILLLPPSEDELVARLNKRAKKTGESGEAILKRLATCHEEMLPDIGFDLIVINDNVQDAKEKILRFIEGHALRIDTRG